MWREMSQGRRSPICGLGSSSAPLFRSQSRSTILLKNIRQISSFLFNQSSKIMKGLSTFLSASFSPSSPLLFSLKDGDRLFLRVKEALPGPPERPGPPHAADFRRWSMPTRLLGRSPPQSCPINPGGPGGALPIVILGLHSPGPVGNRHGLLLFYSRRGGPR